MKKILITILLVCISLILGCSNPTGYTDSSLKLKPGDINLNSLAFEISDAVLYQLYFVYGESVFTKDIALQIENSDTNQDGKYLTVADFQHVITVINGNDYPTNQLKRNVPAQLNVNGNILEIDIEAGASMFIFEGLINLDLLADEMDISVDYETGDTRVMIMSLDGATFTGGFLWTNGNLKSAEISTYKGETTNLTIIK